jgi:hypothetical protein
MAVDLDVPDGMSVQDTIDVNGVPVLEFYTGRLRAAQYDAADVRELVDVLLGWLKEHE